MEQWNHLHLLLLLPQEELQGSPMKPGDLVRYTGMLSSLQETVLILEKKGSLMKVLSPNGEVGWLDKFYLEVIQ